MSEERYKPESGDYSKLRYRDLYSISKLSNDIARFQLKDKDFANEREYNEQLNGLEDDITEIIRSNNETLPVYVDRFTRYNVDGLPETIALPSVKLSDFAAWAVKTRYICPHEILELAIVGNDSENELKASDEKVGGDNETLAALGQREGNPVKVAEQDPCAGGPLIPDERRRYGLLKLQKDNMDMAIKAAVEAGLYYAGLKDGDIFDKDMLFKKITEWNCAQISDEYINLIYQALPPKHKRKPGEKKTNNKTK